ncbi:hypothetical protein PoB_003318500 [Plakobranchus ocellatus]|uniref:Uncharacterized protein n=1 Tax=Plakobranchus ocellatus TaxID=259542 RepID=A0AAV4AH45_9GAST|nr:hypothetical protein PoB_003318500 [Plakobranchus ocellatus]
MGRLISLEHSLSGLGTSPFKIKLETRQMVYFTTAMDSCTNLIVGVDYKPLLKIFSDCCHDNIPNPRLQASGKSPYNTASMTSTSLALAMLQQTQSPANVQAFGIS